MRKAGEDAKSRKSKFNIVKKHNASEQLFSKILNNEKWIIVGYIVQNSSLFIDIYHEHIF